MLKKLTISVAWVLMSMAVADATEQQFYAIDELDELEDKYEGYKTTLNDRFRGIFSGDNDEYRDIGLYETGQQPAYQNNYRSNGGSGFAAMSSFRDQFSGFTDQGYDFGTDSYENLTRGFQSEFRGLFARNDSLIKEFSVPQPRYFNQGYSSPGQTGNGSGNNKRPVNSPAGSNQAKSSAASGYDIEQPVLISWVFSVIAFVREHPLMTGVIVLVVLSLFSLLQAIIQRHSRPFS